MLEPSHVSIVDDDQSFRDSLRRLLISLGYVVEAFPSAAAFLASPTLARTDCLIADIHMPEASGIDLYAQLVNAGHRFPTLLVTAYPDDRTQERMLAAGVRCYLRKPLEEGELIACLRCALAHEPP